MDNNTILRIKVPAALYESVKKQLTLTEAAKGKAHYGAGMEVVKEKKTKVPKDGMKKMEETKDQTQDKMKKERTLDELKMAKTKLEARINEMESTKEPVNEIGVLAASGAVALGLLGAYGLYKGIKWVGSTLGDAALELAYKLDTAAATKKAVSRKERYLQVIQGIAKKFEGDQQLAQMYQNLPEYQPGLGLKHSDKVKMNNERTKQLKQIGDYIKSKLTDEELQYFADVSSILRTGELKTGFYPI